MAINMKPENETKKIENRVELSWDDIEDEDQLEQEDQFSVPEENVFPVALWYHGYNPILDYKGKPAKDKQGKDIMNRGMFFKKEHMAEDFKQVMERMAEDETIPEEDRLVRFISVKHESGDVVDYAQFNMEKVKFYPLMIGLSAKDQILAGQKIQGPTFTYDLYAPKDGKYTFDRNIGILLVVDALVQYGYVDSQMLPRPIQFRMSGDTGFELYNVLKRHNQAVDWARNRGMKLGGKAPEPYMIGMQIRSDVDTQHGQNKKSRAVKIDAYIPSPQEMREGYIEEMYAGPELHKLLKRMLYIPVEENGRQIVVAEGPIIKWCADRIRKSRERYDRLNPGREKLQWGTHDALPWMIALQNGENPFPENGKSGQKLDPAIMDRQLQMLHSFFTDEADEDAVGILSEARDTLESGDVNEDMLKAIQTQIAKYTAQKKEIENNPSGEQHPF